MINNFVVYITRTNKEIFQEPSVLSSYTRHWNIQSRCLWTTLQKLNQWYTIQPHTHYSPSWNSTPDAFQPTSHLTHNRYSSYISAKKQRVLQISTGARMKFIAILGYAKERRENIILVAKFEIAFLHISHSNKGIHFVFAFILTHYYLLVWHIYGELLWIFRRFNWRRQALARPTSDVSVEF